MHSRSRTAYKEFNEWVSVDSTYDVNRYKTLFVSIVSINHHRQSILFHSTLISREDKDTYK